MDHHPQSEDHTPPDCFRLEELEIMQSFENQVLAQVNYYFWLDRLDEITTSRHFLYFLELVFDDQRSLLLSSGEDSEAIRVSNAESLVKTAEALRALHTQAVIQRVPAEGFPLWAAAQGKKLAAVRLSSNEQRLYVNDALLLDFETQRILVALRPQGGLDIGPY